MLTPKDPKWNDLLEFLYTNTLPHEVHLWGLVQAGLFRNARLLQEAQDECIKVARVLTCLRDQGLSRTSENIETNSRLCSGTDLWGIYTMDLLQWWEQTRSGSPIHTQTLAEHAWIRDPRTMANISEKDVTLVTSLLNQGGVQAWQYLNPTAVSTEARRAWILFHEWLATYVQVPCFHGPHFSGIPLFQLLANHWAVFSPWRGKEEGTPHSQRDRYRNLTSILHQCELFPAAEDLYRLIRTVSATDARKERLLQTQYRYFQWLGTHHIGPLLSPFGLKTFQQVRQEFWGEPNAESDTEPAPKPQEDLLPYFEEEDPSGSPQQVPAALKQPEPPPEAPKRTPFWQVEPLGVQFIRMAQDLSDPTRALETPGTIVLQPPPPIVTLQQDLQTAKTLLETLIGELSPETLGNSVRRKRWAAGVLPKIIVLLAKHL